jgi:hypothetical protein
MKTIEYWEVIESYDRDSKNIGNFSDEQVARHFASGKNHMYRSVHKRIFTIFDTIEDFENNTREKIRERALAKLTVEERQALGISI